MIKAAFAKHFLEAPSLETGRLKLRAHTMTDFPRMAAMWAEPKVVQFIGGKPSTEQQSWARLLNYRGHWSLMGFGYWAVEEKSSGLYIGELGFADFKRDLKPSIKGLPEMGWALVPSVHGKGYAAEALQAALEWADSHFASRETVCMIDPENIASIHLAKKFGFREAQKAEYGGLPTLLFSKTLKVQNFEGRLRPQKE